MVILKMLRQSAVPHSYVPKFIDVTLVKIYNQALKEFPELESYFPHYDKGYLPPRQFFWDILNSLKPQFVQSIMRECMEKRCGMGEDADEMELIKIRTDIYDEIMSASHIHRK
jgi:hypothetical protein